MLGYKVFRQQPDHSFHEIAQTQEFIDADCVLHNWTSGMITHEGKIISTKNLFSPEDTPSLPIDFAAQP